MIQVEYPPRNVKHPTLCADYDAVVIGGGPAGSTVATLVAREGFRVLVLERSPGPRFHVGESLIPETYWTLERLGMLPQLRASAFPKKFSVQFISEDGKESAPFYFDDYNPHESSQTWQVERGDFDQLLLENSIQNGVTVRTNAQVLKVLFEGAQAVGVQVRLNDHEGPGEVVSIRSRVVIDATGLTALLANHLSLRTPDPSLRKGAIWTYWQNAHREPNPRDEGATLILSTRDKNSWFWYIPLQDNITSIGVTGDSEYIFDRERGTLADIYQQETDRCPGLIQRLAKATRVRDFFATRDFSYLVKQQAGPGWVMAGDAAGFIDPIYSSGVYLAFKSGEMVADAVAAGLKSGNLSGEQLGSWIESYNSGKQMFHQLVHAFYTKEFSFGAFLRKYPHHKQAITDILIGNVFRDGLAELFVDMHREFPETARYHAATKPFASNECV